MPKHTVKLKNYFAAIKASFMFIVFQKSGNCTACPVKLEYKKAETKPANGK